MKLTWHTLTPPWYRFWEPNIYVGVSEEGVLLTEISPGKRPQLLRIVTGLSSGVITLYGTVDSAKTFLSNIYTKINAPEPVPTETPKAKVVEMTPRIQ